MSTAKDRTAGVTGTAPRPSSEQEEQKMTDEFMPERPEGATFYECETCHGTGVTEDEDEECPDCDGTGEWFE